MSLQDTDLYEKLPEDLKVFLKTSGAFASVLATYSKLLETILSDLKEIKAYFKETKGGFMEDLSSINKENKANLTERLDILEKKIDSMGQQLFNRIALLLTGASGIIGLIVYLVEHFLLKEYINKVVEEITKNLK